VDDEKHCPLCDEDWPATSGFFYIDRTSKDGLYYCCKACVSDIYKSGKGRRLEARPSDELARSGWPRVNP